MTYPVRSKQFWDSYILTVQLEEGEKIRARANEKIRKQVEDNFTRYYPKPIALPSFTYIDNSWNWNMFNTTKTKVVQHDRSKSSEKEKKKEESNGNLIFFGIAAATFAAAVAAYNFRSLKRQEVVLEKTSNIKNRISELPDSSIKIDITIFMDHKHKIDEIRATKFLHHVVTSVTFLIGALALTSGAMLMLPWMIVAGKIIMLFSTVGFIFSLVYHWNDEESAVSEHQNVLLGNAATQTKGLADEIRVKLTEYGEDMTTFPQPGRPAPYAPLYPDLYNLQWASHPPSFTPENAV